MLNSGSHGLFIWNYDAILTKCYHRDLGEYYTYGIKVSGSRDSDFLNDVSVCEETVAKMTELFNRYQLSPVHLRDIVEDMLT